MLRLAGCALLGCLLWSCATTPYRDTPVEKLTDQQLVDELAAASEGVGRQIDRAQFLIATRPDSLYVLSSSTTNFFGTSSSVVSAYAVPTRYGYQVAGSSSGVYSGAAQTRYHYTDVNALAQVMHDLGAAVAQGRASANRRRSEEVLAEATRRFEQRRNSAQVAVDSFFERHRAAPHDKALVTSVLAWVPKSSTRTQKEELEAAASIIQSMERGPGVVGDWYGVLSQLSTMSDGRKLALNNFVRIKLRQEGSKVAGEGELGTGERIEIDARVIGADVVGTVANSKAQMLVSVTGKIEPDRVVLEFHGGSTQQRADGHVALFR